MLPPTVEQAVRRYLADVDRRLPGLVAGFYVVGSVALGAYVEGRSDIDFVAVVDDRIGDRELRALRHLHLRSGIRTGLDALRHGRSPVTGTCNGVFIRTADPVPRPAPSALPLDPQPGLLRRWNLDNLEQYWRPWAMAAPGARRFRLRPGWCTAWGVLGPLRLHHTIATGDVVSKESAGEWGLEVLPASRHALVEEALAYRRGEPSTLRLPAKDRAARTSELALR